MEVKSTGKWTVLLFGSALSCDHNSFHFTAEAAPNLPVSLYMYTGWYVVETFDLYINSQAWSRWTWTDQNVRGCGKHVLTVRPSEWGKIRTFWIVLIFMSSTTVFLLRVGFRVKVNVRETITFVFIYCFKWWIIRLPHSLIKNALFYFKQENIAKMQCRMTQGQGLETLGYCCSWG